MGPGAVPGAEGYGLLKGPEDSHPGLPGAVCHEVSLWLVREVMTGRKTPKSSFSVRPFQFSLKQSQAK